MNENINEYIKSIEKHWLDEKNIFQIKVTFKPFTTKIHYSLKNIRFFDGQGNKNEYVGLSINGYILNVESFSYIDSEINCKKIEFDLCLLDSRIEIHCKYDFEL